MCEHVDIGKIHITYYYMQCLLIQKEYPCLQKITFFSLHNFLSLTNGLMPSMRYDKNKSIHEPILLNKIESKFPMHNMSLPNMFSITTIGVCPITPVGDSSSLFREKHAWNESVSSNYIYMTSIIQKPN